MRCTAVALTSNRRGALIGQVPPSLYRRDVVATDAPGDPKVGLTGLWRSQGGVHLAPFLPCFSSLRAPLIRTPVDEAGHELYLRAQHLGDGDEVGAHHVPVGVLEGELEIVERVQALQQRLHGLVPVLGG